MKKEQDMKRHWKNHYEATIIPNVDEVVTATGFSCKNTSGGTICSNQKIRCKLTKKFFDYETGWGYWAKPLEEIDPEQFSDIDKKIGSKYNGDGRIFVNEWEINRIQLAFDRKQAKSEA
jgi:hypothetical protein